MVEKNRLDPHDESSESLFTLLESQLTLVCHRNCAVQIHQLLLCAIVEHIAVASKGQTAILCDCVCNVFLGRKSILILRRFDVEKNLVKSG